MVLQHLNWLAVAVSAIVYFCLGAVWFGPLFGKMWMKGHGITQPTEEEKKKMNIGMMMGMSFVKTCTMTILTAYIVMIINYNGNMITALKIGAVLGGIASFPIGINYLFMKKPFSIWLVDGGYHACGVIISSVILSVWR
jgi:hypothetical protein